LYEAFGLPEFDEMYEKYERAYSVPKTKINAQKLFMELLKERAETGRIYIMNIDHCNSHSSFFEDEAKISMSNLCQEITLPTTPLTSPNDKKGEVALCILSAINVGNLTNDLKELPELCDLAVRALDEVIEYQDYPLPAAEISTKRRRSLGIGFIGLAHFLAKNKVKYDDPEAWKLVHRLAEHFQYNLLKTSIQLSKEKGSCDGWNETKYFGGLMPIDHYKKDVDELVKPEYECDWESLREELVKHGVRNSTLSAQMPSESSSVVSNETNGIEPPRDYLSIKKSKKGPLKQIVPGYPYLKNNYTLLWDMPNNDGYIKVVAVMQKFFDQAISGNWSYNPENYENNEVPLSEMAKDMLTTYKYGWKTSYYQNTYDSKTDEDILLTEEVIDSISNDHYEDYDTDDEDCDACAI
jgi:ribonucleoside-diphosphate reductase alpha chain